MAVAESGDVPERPVPVTEGLAASAVPADPAAAQAACDWDAGRALAELYAVHYQALVRLAALLVRDTATAEEVVQDSFVAMYASWRRLRDSGKASSYLRRCVVNRSRSVLRHQMVTERHMLQPPPEMPSAEQGAMALLERSAVVAALHGLPARQREALVLRYYAGLPEAEIASAMGISQGAVKSHVFRAMSALRGELGPEA
jgi:RNA polymerase sigma-70 factor (sigma-E family)